LRESFLSLLDSGDKDTYTDTINSDFVLVMGFMPSRQKSILKRLRENRSVVYLSAIEDKNMTSIAQIQSRYEAGSEEGVLAIMAKELLSNSNVDTKTKDFFDNLDDGYISAESNIGEEELEEIDKIYKKSTKPMLVLGYDFYNHPRRKNIANIINLFIKYGNFKVFVQNSEDILERNDTDQELQEVAQLDSFDGSVVYTCPPLNRDEEELLIGSQQFALVAKVKDDDDIFVITENGEYRRKFMLDKELKGTIALLPSANGDESYYYKIAKIIKREN